MTDEKLEGVLRFPEPIKGCQICGEACYGFRDTGEIVSEYHHGWCAIVRDLRRRVEELEKMV